MFRNSDPSSTNEIPPLEPGIKLEPEDDATPNETSSSVSDKVNSKAVFVQVKNREVFDYEPTADSIHASMWPHWWLRAVRSRHKLRVEEAKKNVRFKTGLQHLLKEALEVRTINLEIIALIYEHENG